MVVRVAGRDRSVLGRQVPETGSEDDRGGNRGSQDGGTGRVYEPDEGQPGLAFLTRKDALALKHASKYHARLILNTQLQSSLEHV